MKPITRRRMIHIIGAASCFGSVLPTALMADERVVTSWSGISLGADANIKLLHPNADVAKLLLRQCLREIARLEQLFSLYKPGSLISKLNTTGKLINPPKEMVELLTTARRVSEQTNGSFDITVQQYWQTQGRNQQHGNWRDVAIQPDQILFKKPHMQITLNGIAQGYITDKVTALLKRGGVQHALVYLGEHVAIGPQPSGRPWRIGVEGAEQIIELENKAVATSSHQQMQHIIDPKTGNYAKVKPVTVVANNATIADAVSTAYGVMGKSGIFTL